MAVLASATKERKATLVDGSTAKDYKTPIPINQFFKPVFMVMFQKSRLKQLNVQIVHDMPAAEAEKRSQMDVGIFTAKFGKWTAALNWTQEKHQKLPSHYIHVEYGDTFCGVISPNSIRTCWNCGAGGWSNGAGGRVYLKASSYDEFDRWQAVFCPTCHETDWVARLIEPSRFMRDCIAEIAESTNQAKRWRQFGGDAIDQQIQLASKVA